MIYSDACWIRDGVADSRDVPFGRPDALQAVPYDRGYRYGEGAYRPSAGPDYSLPARGADQYNDSRGYGGHRDHNHVPSYARDSSRSQYPPRGSDAYSGQRMRSNGVLHRDMPSEPLHDESRWSRGRGYAPVGDSRSPSYADRLPSYSDRPPSYGDRPPSYAERRPSYVERPSYAERPQPSHSEQTSKQEEPAYRPLPTVEYTPIVDEALFPPPPPPTRCQLAGRSGDLTVPADGGTPKDLEREAFNAELDRVAAALEKVCSARHLLPWQILQCAFPFFIRLWLHIYGNTATCNSLGILLEQVIKVMCMLYQANLGSKEDRLFGQSMLRESHEKDTKAGIITKLPGHTALQQHHSCFLQERHRKREAPLPLPSTEEPSGLSKDAVAAENTAAMAVAAGEVAAATAQAQAAVPGSDEHKTAEVRAIRAATHSHYVQPMTGLTLYVMLYL